jgi:beta-galactosidase
MVNGEEGTIVAPVPLEARFRRDLYNEGVVAQWYLPEFNDHEWGTENTFLTWDAQDPPVDAKGHDYDGYGWYRFLLKVPREAVDKPLRLHFGGIINEGWVWINGQYAGHRPWLLWWEGREPNEMDLDVASMVKPGDNLIAVRVWNNADIGGLFRRGFLWAPRK